jgi:hypothetical protein
MSPGQPIRHRSYWARTPKLGRPGPLKYCPRIQLTHCYMRNQSLELSPSTCPTVSVPISASAAPSAGAAGDHSVERILRRRRTPCTEPPPASAPSRSAIPRPKPYRHLPSLPYVSLDLMPPWRPSRRDAPDPNGHSLYGPLAIGTDLVSVVSSCGFDRWECSGGILEAQVAIIAI